MRLRVGVIEARNLLAMDLNGFSDPYVRLQLGKYRSRTKVVKKCLNPTWGEDFNFKVDDLEEELLISVLDEDQYKTDDFIGEIKVSVSQVFDAENKSLGAVWYPLQPKNKKSKKDCGEILVSISFFQKSSTTELGYNGGLTSSMRKATEATIGSPVRELSGAMSCPLPSRHDDIMFSKEEKSGTPRSIGGRFAHFFNKNSDTASTTSSARSIKNLDTPTSSTRSIDSLDLGLFSVPEVSDDISEENLRSESFEEVMRIAESKDMGGETPSNLTGGVLLDQLYMILPSELNTLLFAPDSSFFTSLADLQGTTEVQIEPWKFENGDGSLKRAVSYLKAPTKMIKAVKAYEDQTYLKADGKVYAVLASVSTPDVIYGGTFKIEILYSITPGPELPSGEQCSCLVISWRMNFLQSTMMKGMIENGVRQGLRDSFEQYAGLLAQSVKPVDSKDIGLNKDQVLASLQVEPESDWKLAVRFFANFTVISSFFIGLYVLIHVWLSLPITHQGLEFNGLDLPDSIGEFIVSAVLVLQGQRVFHLMSRFMQARNQKGNDSGVKAQGDGWLLTVALIEGSSLATVDSSGFCDPYVVFTVNGKTRSSSIKFQNTDPQWNEIFEFDAMDEPPSVLNVEIYDFDGPFDVATLLGRAEINFVRSKISDLADVWIPLQGKTAQACQSKMHLRIFLVNTRGGNVVGEYLSKMEKEVGKKINVRSPQTNSAFQKLFSLPPEEFLINDFTCHLRRKMPLQGRLFLSARIVGFHTNLFGRRTNFSFLWDDVEGIQVLSPTLSSMGSPVIVMTLRPGRGMEAKHGAKTQDEEGRLKFHFQSFASFNVANKTIMALCKGRSLSPEQKVQMVEEDSENKLQSEESGIFLGLEEVTMSEIHSCTLTVPTKFFVELFGGEELDYKAMEGIGCQNYSCSPWESEKVDVYERQVYYEFDKRTSTFKGEVTSSQQKSPLPDRNGWIFEEVMTLHGVPLGDNFNVHVKYQVENVAGKPKGCFVRVFFGIAWLKSTRHKTRITKNIDDHLQNRIKVTFGVVEKEYAINQ